MKAWTYRIGILRETRTYSIMKHTSNTYNYHDTDSGGRVVTVLLFNPDNPSSNPSDVYSLNATEGNAFSNFVMQEQNIFSYFKSRLRHHKHHMFGCCHCHCYCWSV